MFFTMYVPYIENNTSKRKRRKVEVLWSYVVILVIMKASKQSFEPWMATEGRW